MLETPHIVVGAAIALKVVNPALAIPLAFGSHFLLEKIPHWNPHLNTETEKYGKPTKKSTLITTVDATLALGLGLFIASRVLPDTGHFVTIIAASFAAALPDIVEAPYLFLNMRGKIIKRWIYFQKSIQADIALVPGLLTQLVTVIAAFWWIFS